MTYIDAIIRLIQTFCFLLAGGAFLYLAINYWKSSTLNQKNKLKMDMNEIKDRINSMPLTDLVKLNNDESAELQRDADKTDKPT